MHMGPQLRHKDYLLAAVSTRNDNGTYRSRVALTAVKQGRPQSQRFIDFESFSAEVQADERALAGGKSWVDDQLRIASRAFPTDFGTIV